MKQIKLNDFEIEMISKSIEQTAECDFDNLDDAQEFAKEMFLNNTARKGFFRRKRDGSITYNGYSEWNILCRIINDEVKTLWDFGHFRRG